MDWTKFTRDVPMYFELEKLVATGTSRLGYYLCIGPKENEYYFEQTESFFIDSEWTRTMRYPIGGTTRRFLKAVRHASRPETKGLHKGTVEIELEINEYDSKQMRIPSEWVAEIHRRFPPPRPTR